MPLMFFQYLLLVFLKELLEEKLKGQSKYNAAVATGEKLLISTNPEGREVVRKELRQLHDQWDCVNERIANAHRSLHQAATQWTLYMGKSERLFKWIDDKEQELQTPRLCSSLDEKTEQLESLKVFGTFTFSAALISCSLLLPKSPFLFQNSIWLLDSIFIVC